MIRYLVRETFKSQITILFGLLIIFFCLNLVKILKSTVEGEIPANLILILLGLNIPIITKFFLPLSLFLAILITFGKFYTFNEITAMYACTLNKGILLKATLILIFFTSIIATINVIWLAPYSSRYQEKILRNVKNNPILMSSIAGRFQNFNNKDFVLFIEKVKDNKFNKVFLAQLPSKVKSSFSVIIADSGYLKQSLNGTQVIILDKGTCYEGNFISSNFRITDFISYYSPIKYNPTLLNLKNSDQADMISLFRSKNPNFQAELHWRLTLIFSVLVMALIVVPLSTTNCKDRFLSMLPAILLYLFFFLLQSFCKFNFVLKKNNLSTWMWTINVVYLLLAIVMNIWDTVPMRYIRSSLTKLKQEHHN